VRFGYRDYDPAVGRWTAKDPIGFGGGDTDLYGYCFNNPIDWVDPIGEWIWVAGGAFLGGLTNLGAAYLSSGGDLTFQEGVAAFTGGAFAGAIGALAGPIGGSVAKALGQTAGGWLGIWVSAVFSGAGSYAGQVYANLIDPCHAADPMNAAFWGAIGGAVAKALPTNTLNTVAQANFFGPTTAGGLFGSSNSAWFWGASATSAGLGGASNWGGPF